MPGKPSGLVAEIDGQIVGTVQLALYQRHVHLIGLAVHPDYQRCGVAQQLIQLVIKRARSLGHNVVALDTIRETGNVGIFERIGFRVTGEELATWCESDDFSKLHEVNMERVVA